MSWASAAYTGGRVASAGLAALATVALLVPLWLSQSASAAASGSAFGLTETWTNGGYYGDRGTYFADVTGDARADAIVVNNDRIAVRRVV